MKTFGVVARPKSPEGYIGLWINIYKHGKYFQSGGVYKRRTEADMVAKPYRHDCIYAHVKVNKNASS